MKLNKRKQGISLIVLVITIIVMIIIAAAIILALNSANITSKTSWAQLSSDRASLQSEYAVILADIIAKDNTTDDNYIGLSIEDVRNNPEFIEWCGKVKNTNSLFTIYGDEETEKATPAEIEVRLELTTKEIEAMGLNIAEGKVKGYDWVELKVTTLAETAWEFKDHISGYDFLEYFNFEEQTGWEDFPEGCIIENEDVSYEVHGFTLEAGDGFDAFGTVQSWGTEKVFLYLPVNEQSEINGWVTVDIETVEKYLYGEISTVEEFLAGMTVTTAPTVIFSEESNEALMNIELIEWMYKNAKRID